MFLPPDAVYSDQLTFGQYNLYFNEHINIYDKQCLFLPPDAVYSDQLTGSQGPEPRYIQRVPYFVLVKQAHRQRNDCDELLAEQLEVVKERSDIFTLLGVLQS